MRKINLPTLWLTVLLLPALFPRLGAASTDYFPQSVASGDPRPDSVILWTRLVDAAQPGVELSLKLELASDPDFSTVVLVRENLLARAAHDGCVKVAAADLQPATHYWYRFVYQETHFSPTGRTKTAPAPDQSVPVRFAFLNCQDYVGRYYNTLSHLVEHEADSLDFIVHLGDYIYETTGDPGFQTPGADRAIAFQDNAGAIDLGGFQAAASLDNYRELYRIYRTDPSLQRLHELFPMLVIWDDHEYSDDRHGAHGTYRDGGTNELDPERLRHAEQAFFEYLPTAIGLDDQGVNIGPADLYPNTRIYRDFQFGSQLHLLLTDYRSYRPDHLIAEDAFPGAIVMDEPTLEAIVGPLWASLRDRFDPYIDMDQATNAVRKATITAIMTAAYEAEGLDSTAASERAIAAVAGNLSSTYVNRAFTAAGQGDLVFPLESLSAMPRGLSFLYLGKQDLFSSNGSRYVVARDTYAIYAGYRALLDPASQDAYGPAQTQWLAGALAQSTAKWKVLGSSVSFCPITFDFAAPPFPLPPGFPDELKLRLLLNADHWDGFPQAKQQVLELLAEHNAAIISGDIHGSFITRHLTTNGLMVPEFTGPSVSSETFRAAIAEQAARNPALAGIPGLDQLVANTDLLIRDAVSRLPEADLVDLNTAAQGYVVIETSDLELRARYVLLEPGNVGYDYSGSRFTELLDALAQTSDFTTTFGATGLTLEKQESGAANVRLQLLHSSDLEGGVDAIVDAPNFAAMVDYFLTAETNTLILNAGDSYIPGPFFSAAGDGALRSTLDTVNEFLFGLPGLDIREGVGRADVSLMNIIGFDASCLGNHEFDSGTAVIRELILPDIRGATPNTVRWLGAQFPYLSANLNFTMDPSLAGLQAAHGGLLTTDFQSTPDDLSAARSAPKLASSAIVVRNGEVFGIVGATTPLLAQISSPGATTVKAPGAGSNDMVALATILQPIIDALRDQGVNKIILATHLQQLALETELVPLLHGVDLCIAGGSDSILANPENLLRAGDSAVGPYPVVTTNADGQPALIVSTDGQYKYVGRLVVDFDPAGVILPESLNPARIGPWTTETAMVEALWGSLETAFSPGGRGDLAKQVTDGVLDIVNVKDGNILGQTSVFIEGRRALVRTEETTLGNLTADANLVVARLHDPTVVASIKNGGGIRAEIGLVDGYTGELKPPVANPLVGKAEGEISQLDVENSLRFNNNLSLLTVSAAGLKDILEHGVAATGPTLTPGQFPQVAGLWFVFDTNGTVIRFDTNGVVVTPGTRIQHLGITDANGVIIDLVVSNGVVVGDPTRLMRIVTLDFLANPQSTSPGLGGDGYPFPALGSDRVNLRDVLADPGLATFALPGTEQDAFAEFLITTHLSVPYRLRETSASLDDRIVDLAAHQPHLLTPFLTSTGSVLTVPTIPGWEYKVQSVDQIGGTWQTRVQFTGTGGRETVTDDLPEVPNRFYRLVATP